MPFFLSFSLSLLFCFLVVFDKKKSTLGDSEQELASCTSCSRLSDAKSFCSSSGFQQFFFNFLTC